MSVTNINISVDSELKNQAQDVFASLGLDMTSAFDIFLRQTVEQRSLPIVEPVPKTPRLGGWEGQIWMADNFDSPLDFSATPKKVPKMSREEMFGCMRGQFKMTDDFDAPLEDFKEYME